MSFYYDFAKNIAAASWKDLIDQTLHFLFALRRRREETLGSPRPLVFMCFSFGSVILKKVHSYRVPAGNLNPNLCLIGTTSRNAGT